MNRRAALPLGLVWLVAVAGPWLLTTVLLTAAGDRLSQAAASALLACLVVGGPATAAALRVRRRHGFGPAALTGLGVAAAVLVFIWSFMAASGAALRDTWSAVIPALVVTVVQLGLALALRGRPGPGPGPGPGAG